MHLNSPTIAGYDDGLADVFDELLKSSYQDSLQFVSYSDPETFNGKEPLCGEVIAWRHPKFGNYTDGALASSFVRAHNHDYSRQVHDGFTCLIWLLTNAANWLPDAHRARLTNGMRTRTYPWAALSDIIAGNNNAFCNALWRKT